MQRFFKRMTTRTLVRVLAGFLAVVLVLTGLTLTANARRDRYRMALEQNCQRAFTDFVSSVQEMNTSMRKGLVAASPSMLTAVCTDIYGKSLAAVANLGELPLSAVSLEHIASFLGTAGDYALYLSRTAAAGGITDEERENLRALQDTAQVLTQNLQALQTEIQRGSMTLGELMEASEQMADEGLETPLLDSFSNMEQEFPELPSLIYDGPFSQHVESKTPAMTADAAWLTDEELLEKAAAFFSLRPAALTRVTTGEGTIPTAGFSANVDGGELYVEVSRQGGYVTNMFNSRPVAEAALSAQAALNRANDLLAKNGLEHMAVTYYQTADNVLTANFAYTDGGVTFYTDLVKVSVALDTGRIVGYEAAGYLTNHRSRTLPVPAVTEEAARALVLPDLRILSSSLAVIPTAGNDEVLCREFKCEDAAEQHCIIYVNAETGREEKILLLLEDESGTLTI